MNHTPPYLALLCALAGYCAEGAAFQPSTLRDENVAAPAKPSVSVILAADLGSAALGCQGVVQDINAPHLDALVASGVPAVAPFTRTETMHGAGDVADDVCVWVHPTQGARSVMLGVNKSDQRFGGLHLFQLEGSRCAPPDRWQPETNWFEPGKKLNNVDAGRGFPAGVAVWDLVCAANRTDRSLDVLRVLTDIRSDCARLELVGPIPIGAGFAAGTDAPYGVALYAPPGNGSWSAFTSDKQGRVAQFGLRFNPQGHGPSQVLGRRRDQQGRPWQVSEKGCEIEGMVTDPARAVVYLGSEDEGIFRYRLRDGVFDPASKVTVDRVGRRLRADVEGLTMYARADGSGYLLASSQGADELAVYDPPGTQPDPP
jgi:3-phytase